MSNEILEPCFGVFLIEGLSMKSTNDKDKYVFDDAMVLNYNELQTFFKNNWQESKVKEDFNEDFVRMYSKKNTYLVIRSFENNNNKLEKRANEIISFMSLVSLILSNFTSCISLSDKVTTKKPLNIFIYNRISNDIGFNYKFTDSLPIKLSKISTTRKTLKEIYESRYFINLFKLINKKEIPIDKNVKDSIIALYRHFNISDSSVIFLGTIIVIEMLFGQGREKQENLKNRLKVLLSESTYNFYNHYINLSENEDKDIFKIRNDYVHEGNEIHKDNALKALMFVSITFLSLADLIIIKNFQKQSQVLKYLDESFSKSKFQYYDSNVDSLENKFNKNFLSVIYILNYMTPKYKDINDNNQLKIVKKQTFKAKVIVLQKMNNMKKKEAYETVNLFNLELRNTFSSFSEYSRFEYDASEYVNNLLQLIKKYTHPLNFHDYPNEATNEQN